MLSQLPCISSNQVPLAIFGVIALLAALLVTFMPETSNTPLPDTIQVFDNDRDDGDYDVLNKLFSVSFITSKLRRMYQRRESSWGKETLSGEASAPEGEKTIQLNNSFSCWRSLCKRRKTRTSYTKDVPLIPARFAE